MQTAASLRDARSNGTKYYFTGKTCKRGHVSVRYTSTQTCAQCERERAVAYYAANKEHMNVYAKKWRQENRGSHNAHLAKRHTAKLHATPNWLTPCHFRQIKVFYAESARLSAETNIVHHVDHIVPLQGANICGLHVPWNLQVLKMSGNLSKGNSFNDAND